MIHPWAAMAFGLSVTIAFIAIRIYRTPEKPEPKCPRCKALEDLRDFEMQSGSRIYETQRNVIAAGVLRETSLQARLDEALRAERGLSATLAELAGARATVGAVLAGSGPKPVPREKPRTPPFPGVNSAYGGKHLAVDPATRIGDAEGAAVEAIARGKMTGFPVAGDAVAPAPMPTREEASADVIALRERLGHEGILPGQVPSALPVRDIGPSE